ncbi:MAG: hypothetical protein WAS21_28720 [Geminicoccaceae bacterium]
MRIFAKIRQVYDRLCGRKEAGADRMRQEQRLYLAPDGVLADEAPNTRRKRLLAVERDSKLLGADFGNGA